MTFMPGASTTARKPCVRRGRHTGAPSSWSSAKKGEEVITTVWKCIERLWTLLTTEEVFDEHGSRGRRSMVRREHLAPRTGDSIRGRYPSVVAALLSVNGHTYVQSKPETYV
jgi:hypothetical protein